MQKGGGEGGVRRVRGWGKFNSFLIVEIYYD
jgi:hypothetical protein